MTTFRIFTDNHGNLVPMTNDQLFEHYFNILMDELERIKHEGGTAKDFIGMYQSTFNTTEKKTINGFLRGRMGFRGSIDEVLTTLFNVRILEGSGWRLRK